ncbi:hypothetical protein [Photobacterium phosphoreum]|uniref:hypothetical protein n=1 Tax=Photobacterium phosphoreum TaxID=659 RepID=UPI001E36E740|nr:hypothetical protein [Photobacterium phosphoreum]MCD9477134.1 hypothetical protein [Photobacterium phosphoreum]MCF2177989.1 hypothetical protein [Photobacterium phosphoreum]
MRDIVIQAKNSCDLIIQLKKAGEYGYNAAITSKETDTHNILHSLNIFCERYDAGFYVLDMREQTLLSDDEISNIIIKIATHDRYSHLLTYLTEFAIDYANPLCHNIFRLLDIICNYSMYTPKRHHIALLNFNEESIPDWGNTYSIV